MGLQAFLTESDIISLTDAQAEAAALATYSLPADHSPYDYSWIGIQIRNYMTLGWLPNMTTVILAGMVPLVRGITYSGMSVGLTLDSMLGNKGYDFADPNNRALLTTMMPGQPQEAIYLLNAFLFVGQPTCPRWQSPQYGIYSTAINSLTTPPTILQSTAPSQSEIATIRASIATRASSDAAAAWFANLCNEANGINSLIASGTATISAIKTLVAAG